MAHHNDIQLHWRIALTSNEHKWAHSAASIVSLPSESVSGWRTGKRSGRSAVSHPPQPDGWAVTGGSRWLKYSFTYAPPDQQVKQSQTHLQVLQQMGMCNTLHKEQELNVAKKTFKWSICACQCLTFVLSYVRVMPFFLWLHQEHGHIDTLLSVKNRYNPFPDLIPFCQKQKV